MSTLAWSKVIPHLLPSAAHNVSQNIEALFDPSAKPSPSATAALNILSEHNLLGAILMADAVAAKERCTST